MIRYVDADPALLAAVDDRSPHRRVTGARGVPCLVRHDLIFARAWNQVRVAGACARLCGELVFVDQAAESVAATEPIE